MRYQKWIICEIGSEREFLYHWRKCWAMTGRKRFIGYYEPPAMKWKPLVLSYVGFIRKPWRRLS